MLAACVRIGQFACVSGFDSGCQRVHIARGNNKRPIEIANCLR
jgi:hypothetical protein